MTKLVYGSHGHTGEANWLVGMCGFELTGRVGDSTLLLIGGGADIDPTLYTDKPSKLSYPGSGARDRAEVNDFKSAQEMNIKTIGICRGAQMICALSGGKLIQHVSNHGSTHDIQYIDGTITSMSSLHHQMLYPFDLPEEDYVILAWSRNNRAGVYVLDDDTVFTNELPFEGFVEPEIVWFPKTNALAIQGHPEFLYRSPLNVGESLKKVKEIFDLFYEDKLQDYVNKNTNKQKEYYVKSDV